MKHELTLTLHPRLYNLDANKQFALTKDTVKQLLYGYKKTIVAELTSLHNIHYHCIVEVSNVQEKDRILNRFRNYANLFGKAKTFRGVQFETSYEDYIQKDISRTTQIIHGYPVVCDEYNIFGDRTQIHSYYQPVKKQHPQPLVSILSQSDKPTVKDTYDPH